VDDAFLRDSILNPSMHVTAGFAPIMPTYQGQISEEGLIDLVEYIKTLHSNYRIQQTINTSQVQSPALGQNDSKGQRTYSDLHANQVQQSVEVQRQSTGAQPGMVKP
jgi:cytochrome c oxidase subunit 2